MHGNGLVLKHEKPNKVYFLQFGRSNKQENNFKTLRGCLVCGDTDNQSAMKNYPCNM